MCRMFAFRCAQPRSAEDYCLTASHALVKQSGCDLSGRCHKDGWGLGWYQGGTPRIRKAPNSALDDPNFADTAHTLSSRTAIAHVRDASVGSLSEVNSHPFSHSLWMFAHNGTLTPFDSLAEAIVSETDVDLNSARRGTTDSEHIFFWLLTRMRLAGFSPDKVCHDLQTLVDVIAHATLELKRRSEQATPEEPSKLNFFLTDGHVFVATRFRHSLSMLQQPGSIVISSEPMTNEDWREIPDESVSAVDANLRVFTQPLQTA